MEFFTQGILHITDFAGYDHMLFLIALAAPYSLKEWKPIAWLATAFTLGHSISLGLAASDVVHFSSNLIETLIPVTIALTSLGNIRMRSNTGQQISLTSRYSIAALFGLIHGMGFSSFFRMITNDGEPFVLQLLSFNLGVEVGQIIIVLIILGLIALCRKLFTGKEKNIMMALSSFTLTLSLLLIVEKLFA